MTTTLTINQCKKCRLVDSYRWSLYGAVWFQFTKNGPMHIRPIYYPGAGRSGWTLCGKKAT